MISKSLVSDYRRLTYSVHTLFFRIFDYPILSESAVKLSLNKKISKAKDFAKYLKNNDLTISMCYEGKEIMVLGTKAKPKFSKLIIGSNDIQIKNLRQLMRLDNELFKS